MSPYLKQTNTQVDQVEIPHYYIHVKVDSVRTHICGPGDRNKKNGRGRGLMNKEDISVKKKGDA